MARGLSGTIKTSAPYPSIKFSTATMRWSLHSHVLVVGPYLYQIVDKSQERYNAVDSKQRYSRGIFSGPNTYLYAHQKREKSRDTILLAERRRHSDFRIGPICSVIPSVLYPPVNSSAATMRFSLHLDVFLMLLFTKLQIRARVARHRRLEAALPRADHQDLKRLYILMNNIISSIPKNKASNR